MNNFLMGDGNASFESSSKFSHEIILEFSKSLRNRLLLLLQQKRMREK